MVRETNSEQETLELGRELAQQAVSGQVFALIGDLGAGKTVLTRGMAEGLGVTEPVSSPTFTILQIYEGGRLPFYHFDVYRIIDPEEMDEIGYEDYFYGEGVCLVEWADLIRGRMPEGTVWITMEKDLARGFDFRRITVEFPRTLHAGISGNDGESTGSSGKEFPQALSAGISGIQK